MDALFVLLPAGRSVDDLFAGASAELVAARAQLRIRVHPPADDRAHLLSLVRAGRDPAATRWRRGLLLCIGGGALLGMLTAGILAAAFAMFGGLVGVAIAFGAGTGAFLGGFTAAMTGTESARDEVRALADATRRGEVLVSVVGNAELIGPLGAHCDALGLPWRRRE